MSIYRSAVNHPVTTTLLFLAFVVFGVFSLTKTSIAQLPDIDANVIMVMSSYPGASASDVETNLTKVLENSLNGVSNLKEMTSTSQENIAMLVLQFEYGTDVDVATNDVRDKLDMVSSTLPDGASAPTIFKFSMDDMPIMILSATATESLPGLDKILDDKLTTPLARVSGVGTITVSGAPTREIQVYCNPQRLQAYGLSVATIASLISGENRNIPSGSMDVGSRTYSLRIQGEFADPSELLDIVLGSYNGKTVYLRDVATIYDGSKEKEQESYTQGVRSAQIAIQKQSGANTVNVIREVKKKIAEIKKTLPPDIEITTVIDSSDNIINTIKSLRDTILITFIVVMLVVFVFLRKWKATFIIIVSIPIALLASLIYLLATGSTLNIISMSALSLAIGMVVDDAIVVLENVSTHLERGEKPKEAAVHATSEVGISVIASTLTMLCVFLPLTMVSGMAGLLFKELGWIVAVIMIVSTTAALTLVPMMCSQMLKPEKTKKGRGKIMDAVSDWYSKVVGWSVSHRTVVLLSALGIFIMSVVLMAPSLKTELFPTSDQDRISVNVQLPAGTNQKVTGEFARKFYDQIVEEVPEIKISSYSFGQADSDNAFASMRSNGSNVLTMNINVGSSEDRKRTCSEIADVIRGIVRQYPEIKLATVTEGGGMMMGGAASVEIEVYGYDFNDTDVLAREIKQKLEEHPEFAEITLSRDEYTPEYQIEFDRVKLALSGLNSSTVGAAFSAAISGSVASYYREEGDEYSIRVRYSPEYRTSVEDLENVIVYNSAGKAIRIKEVGKVVESEVPPKIQRKDRERIITVQAIMARGRALSEGVIVAESVLADTDVPNSLSTVIAGDFEDQKDMFSDLIVLMLLIIILVYMVMASQFESFMSPFVIMFSVPFAFVGVLLGLTVSNTALGLMAMVGILILLGIVVKNGIVLIDYTILCRERGMGAVEASVTAAKSRLRPILMTTLTTVLGMLPMAIGGGEGSEMWKALGITVCWGLSISTVVTLILIPTAYCVFATRQEKKNK